MLRAVWICLAVTLAASGCDANMSGAPVAQSAEPADPGSGSSLAPSSDPVTPAQPVAPAGTWYVVANGLRFRIDITCDTAFQCAGVMTDEAFGHSATVDSIYWWKDGTLTFRRSGAGEWSWFHTRVVDGVIVGRYSYSESQPAEPSDPTAYQWHVTGWHADYFDRDVAPRVWELLLDHNLRARLRLDRSATSRDSFEAHLKIYSSLDRQTGEGDSYDAQVDAWDGHTLRITVPDPAGARVYTATVAGRFLQGTWVQVGSKTVHALSGARAEVLSHGFATMQPMRRRPWQDRTRRAIHALMMAGNPRPTSASVRTTPSTRIPSAILPVDRDDGDPVAFPQNYDMTEWRGSYTLPDFTGQQALARTTHGFLATPAGPAPAGGFPVVIAVNGHDGSAWATMNPDNEYFWYGDAFARHGFAVLSVDISHRPVADRRNLYAGYETGDDPASGNGAHPAIRSTGLDSDWEEDGERVWDVMRAVDYAQSVAGLDASRIIVTGLSMGGEVATFAAALDPRITMAVPAGFSPDLSVLVVKGSHGCWQWVNADIREYLDPSDLHALIAPRPLVVETGKVDWIYSWRPDPFAGDKQVMRRSRAAWSDAPGRILHYLHYDKHHYHVGAANPTAPTEPEVRTPVLVAPELPWAIDWQDDPTTVGDGGDLFHLIRAALP